MNQPAVLFGVTDSSSRRPRWMGPCRQPWNPQFLAEAHPDDVDDAVGLNNVDYCCAIHYVRWLRYKYDLP